MSQQKSSSKLSTKDYEDLGRRLENIYLTGYIDKKEMLKMSFLKGIVTGLGGVVGATILVGLFVWILSLLGHVPVIDRAAENVKNSVQTKKP